MGAAKIVEGRRFIEPVSLEPGIGDPENPDAAGRNNADTDHDSDSMAESSDAFPLDASEPLDTDSDSTGNSTDPAYEYPLDASRGAPGKARLQNISTTPRVEMFWRRLSARVGQMTLIPIRRISANHLFLV